MITVLGTGSIGMRHLGVLKSLGLEPIAVPVRAAKCAELRTLGYRTAGSLSEARAAGARAAVIATETRRHVEDVAAALALGMPVLCEKPLATCASEAQALSETVERGGIPVFVAYCMRFDPGIEHMTRVLADSVGNVAHARIECRSYLPSWRPSDHKKGYSADALQGGVLRDLSHEVDYARLLFGAPKRVMGVLSSTHELGIDAEELAEAVWELEGGGVVSLGLDYVSRDATRVIRAQGTRGSIECDLLAHRVRARLVGEPETVLVLPADRNTMYERQLLEFMSVLDGAEPRRLASFADGYAVLEVCDAWRRSSLIGSGVPLA